MIGTRPKAWPQWTIFSASSHLCNDTDRVICPLGRQPTFGMLASSKRFDALAWLAIVETTLLDEQQAHQ